MRAHLARLTFAFAAIALLFCAGCASVPGDVGRVQWELAAWDSELADTVGITARFAEGRISGFSGVNSYGADCHLRRDGSVEVGPIRSTKRAGPEPAMHAEAAFIALLAQARSWQMHGDDLFLYDAKRHEILAFSPSQAPAGGSP